QTLSSADVSTRGGGGYRQVQGTLAEGSIDFTMIYAPGDALFDTLEQAFEDRSLVHMAFADDEIVAASLPTGETTRYFEAEFAVLDFSIEQPLEDAMKVNVTLQSGFSNNVPAWKTVAGSG
ncbi:MAG: phage tail tube protein, partial [Pirellulales bacterium]